MKFKYVVFYLSILLVIPTTFMGQDQQFDSLLARYKTISAGVGDLRRDTTQLGLLLQLSESCEVKDISEYAQPAITLADKLLENKNIKSYRKRILFLKASALNNMAYLMQHHGNIPKAVEMFNKSLLIMKEINDKKGAALALYNMASAVANIGDIPRALEYYSEALSLQEQSGDKYGMAQSLNNIGSVYKQQGDITKAMENYRQSLKIRTELDDKKGIATTLNNLGLVFKENNQLDSAMAYYNNSLKRREAINDKIGIAQSLNNIASLYKKQGRVKQALEYYNKSLALKRNVGDKQGIALSLNNISSIFFLQKDYKKAYAYSDSSLNLAHQMGYPILIRDAERSLMKIDSARGDYTGAYNHMKQYVLFRDSINNDNTRKASTQDQLKHEFEKKEVLLYEQHEKEQAVASEKARKQKTIILFSISALLLGVFFALYVFRSLKIAKKQKLVIEQKQKEIIDSIGYARRIQRSILPKETYIQKQINRMKN